MTLLRHLRAGQSVSQSQKSRCTCTEAWDSVGYAATGEVSPLCLRKFQHPRKDYQNHLSKMSSRASRVTGTLSPQLLSCSGMTFTPEQLGAESQCSCDLCPCCLSSRACNIPAWGSACRHAGEKTRSWTCTYLWQSQQSLSIGITLASVAGTREFCTSSLFSVC